LVDALLAKGLDCLAVLDVSHEALQHAQGRLATASPVVTWIEADVTGAWSLKPMDIWHDRAVFHFLIGQEDRARYVANAREVVKHGGSVIIATFGPDGPARCSGLPVKRYSPEALAAELGDGYALVESRPHQHVTPWGTVQSFVSRPTTPRIVSATSVPRAAASGCSRGCNRLTCWPGHVSIPSRLLRSSFGGCQSEFLFSEELIACYAERTAGQCPAISIVSGFKFRTHDSSVLRLC
jgi:hypothetical protein